MGFSSHIFKRVVVAGVRGGGRQRAAKKPTSSLLQSGRVCYSSHTHRLTHSSSENSVATNPLVCNEGPLEQLAAAQREASEGIW